MNNNDNTRCHTIGQHYGRLLHNGYCGCGYTAGTNTSQQSQPTALPKQPQPSPSHTHG